MLTVNQFFTAAQVVARSDLLTVLPERFLPLTGLEDRLVVRELPVETVLLPVNVVEGVIGGFLTEVLPEARRRKLGVIGMKVLGQRTLLEAGFTAHELIRYALAQDIDTAILGCSTPSEVEEDALGATAPPLSAAETEQLLSRVRRRARQLAYYRGVV